MTNENVMLASIDDLLDGTLDDLADMPEFKPFPAGAHTCKLNWKIEPINDIPTVKLKLTYVETLELAHLEDVPPKVGDTTEIAFMLKKKDGTKNELGEGQWKEILTSLKAGGVGGEGATNRQVMEASEGMEVVVNTTVRRQVNKDDKTDIKYYTGIKSVVMI